MQHTIRSIAIATSVCFALTMPTVGYAQDVSASYEESQTQIKQNKSDKRLAKLTKKLGLSESQQAEIKTLKLDSKTQYSALKPALKAYREQVEAIVSADPFDEQAFLQLREANEATLNAKALIKAEAKATMKHILTPDQWDKFQAMKNKHGRKHKRK